jgi:NOL1/NOP2/fmu family ribosome biogenesis protein
MLYGTCTYNIEENENIVKFIIETLGAESISVPLPFVEEKNKYEEIAPSFDKNIYAYRFFPHRTKSEGLFLSLVRKTPPPASFHRGDKPKKGGKSGNRRYSPAHLGKDIRKKLFGDYSPPLWGGSGGEVYMFPEKFIADVEFIGATVYTLSFGTQIGVIKGNDIIPSFDFAHSADINIHNFIVWNIDKLTALKFLKREPLFAPAGIGKGYILLTYCGVPLGWVKNIGARCNNLLPQNRKIRLRNEK